MDRRSKIISNNRKSGKFKKIETYWTFFAYYSIVTALNFENFISFYFQILNSVVKEQAYRFLLAPGTCSMTGSRGEGLSKIRRMSFRTILVRDMSANMRVTAKQIRHNRILSSFRKKEEFICVELLDIQEVKR